MEKIGSYAIERDYSHYVAHAAKTIFAVVGTATKGPIGEAIVCTSAQDLVNKFGPLSPECYALYAGQYFLSQSSKLYFVRAAHESAAAASTDISGLNSSETSIDVAITLSAIEKGTYYNQHIAYVVKKAITEKVDSTENVTITTVTETPTLERINTTTATSTRKKTLLDKEGTTTNYSYDIIIKKGGTTVETVQGIKLEDISTTDGASYTNFKLSPAKSGAAQLTAGVYALTGGNDGIADISAADYINAANALSADLVDMNLFAVPGQSDAAIITAMQTIAETRGDCLFLADPPKGLTRDGVIGWVNGTGEYSHTAFNSSYVATYYDWVTIYDSINKMKVTVPPSVVVAPSIAYSDRTTEVWYAPAGLNRGVIRGVLNSETKLNKSDAELLYQNNINPLYDDPGVGLVIWGQKTLLRADTALNRVNVRRLMNYLKKIVTAACNYLTFEPNDRVTWNSFEMKMLPTLQSIQDKRGIYEYRVIKGETIVTDEDIDNYKMPCMVMIRPTKAAEEIPIYFVITSTGADFNEVLDANGVVTD